MMLVEREEKNIEPRRYVAQILLEGKSLDGSAEIGNKYISVRSRKIVVAFRQHWYLYRRWASYC